MTYTQQQYEALTAAIATGATSVHYGDKTVNYRSLDEMRSIQREMEAELFGKRVNRRRLATVDRGYFKKG